MADDIRFLFQQVADLMPPQRDAWFTEQGIAPEVRAEVEALLEFDSPSAVAFPERVSAAARDFLSSNADPPPGSRCGAYELVRLLGRGGMSAVFLARRWDGEVEQRVAIKLAGYLGDDPVAHERFLRERQFLATLNHPGSWPLSFPTQTISGSSTRRSSF